MSSSPLWEFRSSCIACGTSSAKLVTAGPESNRLSVRRAGIRFEPGKCHPSEATRMSYRCETKVAHCLDQYSIPPSPCACIRLVSGTACADWQVLGGPAPPQPRHVRCEESSCVSSYVAGGRLRTRLFPRFATLRTDIALFDDVEQLRWNILRPHSTCSWRHVETTLLSARNIRNYISRCVIRLSLPLHSSEDLGLHRVWTWRSDNKAQLVKRPRTSPLDL